MRVSVSKERVEPVPGGFGLGLELQGIVSSLADIPEFQNGVESGRGKGRDEGSAAWGAAQGVCASGDAARWSVGVEGIARYQDVIAVRTGIAHGQHDVARQLTLDVDVPLSDLSGPEVLGLVKERSCEGGKSRRSLKNLESVGDAGHGAARTAGRDTAGWSTHRPPAELEDIALGEKGRVLPKALSTLAPGGIVVYGEAAAEYGFIAAQDLIGGANSRFEISPIHVYASGGVDSALIGNQKLARSGIRTSCGGGRNVVGQAASRFCNRRGQVPSQSDVQSQVLGNSPVVLDEGANDFPAAAGDRTVKGLIVFGDAHVAQGKIGFGITGESAQRNPETILEGFGADVHLIGAYINSDMDVVLAANQIDGIVKRKDVSAALKRGVTAIANRPQAAVEQDGNQAAAVRPRCTLRGPWSARAAQVRAGNANAREVGGIASARALRSDVIEDAVIAEGELIDGGRRKDVSFADGHVAGVVDDALIAAEGALLDLRANTAAARHIGGGLIIAKAREDIVGVGERVVQADIELGFIKAAHRLVDEVNSRQSIISIRQGIKIHKSRTKGVNQSGWYFGAGNPGNLAAVGIDCGGQASASVALKGGRGSTARIGVGD